MKGDPSSVSVSTVSSERQQIVWFFYQYKRVQLSRPNNQYLLQDSEKMSGQRATQQNLNYHSQGKKTNQKWMLSPGEKASQTNVGHHMYQPSSQNFPAIKIYQQTPTMGRREGPKRESIGLSSHQREQTSLNYSPSFQFSLSQPQSSNYSEGSFNTPQKRFHFDSNPNLQHQKNLEHNPYLSKFQNTVHYSEGKQSEKSNKLSLKPREQYEGEIKSSSGRQIGVEQLFLYYQQLKGDYQQLRRDFDSFRDKSLESFTNLFQIVNHLDSQVRYIRHDLTLILEKLNKREGDERRKFSFKHKATL